MINLPENQPWSFTPELSCDCADNYVLEVPSSESDFYFLQISDDDFLSNEQLVNDPDFDDGIDVIGVSDWNNESFINGDPAQPNSWVETSSGHVLAPLNLSERILTTINNGGYSGDCTEYALCINVFNINSANQESIKITLYDGTNEYVIGEVFANGETCFTFPYQAPILPATEWMLSLQTFNTLTPPISVDSTITVTNVSLKCADNCNILEILDENGDVIDTPIAITEVVGSLRYTTYQFQPYSLISTNTCGQLRLTDCSNNTYLSNRFKKVVDNCDLKKHVGIFNTDKIAFGLLCTLVNSFKIFFYAPADIGRLRTEGEIVIDNYVLAYADTDRFLEVKYELLPSYLVKALEVAYKSNLFTIDGKQYLPTDGSITPKYQHGSQYGTVDLQIQENLSLLRNSYCEGTEQDTCPPCPDVSGDCSATFICECYPTLDEGEKNEALDCVIENSTGENIYNYLSPTQKEEILQLVTATEYELYMPYDKRNTITGVKLLPTGHGQPNHVGGYADGIGSILAGDDATNALTGTNQRLDTTNPFFDLGYTSRFISELGGTHTKRFVSLSGAYWDETDGSYYDVDGVLLGTGGTGLALAFVDPYMIDLATGLAIAYGKSGTFGGISYSSTNTLANAIVCANAYTLAGFDDWRVWNFLEMLNFLPSGTTATSSFNPKYGPLWTTWGGLLSSWASQHTSTFALATEYMIYNNTVGSPFIRRTTALVASWYHVRNHF
jgi:hypothetical protein